MADTQAPEKLEVLHKSVKGRLRGHHDDVLKVVRTCGNAHQRLTITFHRTLRVADNQNASDLPPDCGTFPLYRTTDYEKSLPKHVSAKGGYFIPMYQREAMWVRFESRYPFAIKLYVGGVNAVSGEPARETEVTMMRRLNLMKSGMKIQDYVVAPKQLWLDGIATGDGHVRQFVAMPLGKGYTVEAQITGEEVIGGLQFEVVPMKISARMREKGLFKMPDGTKHFQIIVRDLDGENLRFQVSGKHTVDNIKSMIADVDGVPPDQQRLIYAGKQMEDGRTLGDLGIEGPVKLHLVFRLSGGGGAPPLEMGIAAGGLINQTIIKDDLDPVIWEPQSGTIFNVQILNSACFEEFTGRTPPETPISAQIYAKYGSPYYAIYDEKPSGIEGSFEGVKSVNEIDKEDQGVKRKFDAVAEVEETTHNPVVLLDHEGNKIGFRTVKDMERAVRERFAEMKI